MLNTRRAFTFAVVEQAPGAVRPYWPATQLSGNKDGRIQLVRVQQMRAFASDVLGRHQPVAAQLPLDA